MAFDKGNLHFFVQDALREYSEDFIVEDRANPVQFRLNGIRYSAHVSYLHDSGNARDNDDETRIQLSRGHIDIQTARAGAGERIAFMGFSENGRVFTAWDPRYVLGLGAETVVSVYARESMIRAVRTSGSAARSFRSTKTGDEWLTISLPSKALGLYLENIEVFHDLKDGEELANAIQDQAPTNVEQANGAPTETQRSGERRKLTSQRTAYARDPRFSAEVLAAYKNACCVCGIQLSAVDAAHIVPHSVDDAEDTVQNGLALCALHHRLYDDALLLPGPNCVLKVNEARVKYLEDTNRSAGLHAVTVLAGTSYSLPEDPDKFPSDEFLRRGLQIRMGE